MIEKLKLHDGDTPGKTFEVKLEYPKPKVATMSNMKCPICGEKIEHIEDGWCNCKNRCLGSGSISLWQEFIRTRKALDVALDWLGQVATPEKCDDDLCREFTKRKLAEIKTALEQKD